MLYLAAVVFRVFVYLFIRWFLSLMYLNCRYKMAAIDLQADRAAALLCRAAWGIARKEGAG